MALNEAAFESPDYLVANDENKFFAKHQVTCHMAAIYWAFRAAGKTEKESRSALKAITRSVCPGCLGTHYQHGSLQSAEYGQLFCTTAVAMNATCMVGDVVIMPTAQMPMHSMVIVEKRVNPARVMIRGFNNHNTFLDSVPQPPYMRYDSVTRDLNARVMPANNLYYVKEYTYIKAALTAAHALGIAV